MSEEAKTYVFGNDSNSMLPALMNNCGMGGNGAWWIIILAMFLWGRNGFGEGNGLAPLMNALNGDTGRDLLAQGIQGNATAISQLANTFNCSVNQMTQALGSLNSGIQSVGSQVGMSGLQVINAIQAGNTTLANQISQCCCENRLLTTTQGYENRIANSENTASIISKIDNQTQVLNDRFCELEKRELNNKISALLEANSTLKSQIDNANQTATITNYVNSAIAPILSDVQAIKAATPSTVTVPYPNLVAVTSPCQQAVDSFYRYNGAWA